MYIYICIIFNLINLLNNNINSHILDKAKNIKSFEKSKELQINVQKINT